MNKTIGIILGVGIIIVAGLVYFSTREETGEMMQKPADSGATMQTDGDTMMQTEESGIMEKESNGMMSAEGGSASGGQYAGAVLAGQSAPLLDFTKADYDAALKTDKLVVLYFYANWCPICKEEIQNSLYPAFDELATDRVIGLRVNYKDSDTDKDEENLARQYGISYQHTKVFVRNGQPILKAPDGWDKARYLAEINKALGQ